MLQSEISNVIMMHFTVLSQAEKIWKVVTDKSLNRLITLEGRAQV